MTLRVKMLHDAFRSAYRHLFSNNQKEDPLLHPGEPHWNLERLANPILSTMPATYCITRECEQNVPFAKPSRSTIAAWTLGSAFFTLTRFDIWRVLYSMSNCAPFQGWTADLLSTSEECFQKAIDELSNPNTIPVLSKRAALPIAILSAIVAYSAARIFYTDYKESARAEMLDREYSAAAEYLAQNMENAKQKQDQASIQETRAIALRLHANLPLIAAHLQKSAKLPPETADRLIQKLSWAISVCQTRNVS